MPNSKLTPSNREAIASGRFYDPDPKRLKQTIQLLLEGAQNMQPKNASRKGEKLYGIITPHAGYAYSGTVTASAFLELKDIEPRKKVFLIGSSHYMDFDGASVYNQGNYTTPLGNIQVDLDLANHLINNSENFRYEKDAHNREHCLKVLLPFLQHLWKDKFEAIPIIIGTQSESRCKLIANDLRPWFKPENLFIISSDLSHYPSYSNANLVDKKTTDAVISANPKILLDQLEKNKEWGIANLATSMCGWTSVLTLMYLAEGLEDARFSKILYQNSGDSDYYGDKKRVVGYQSLAIYDSKTQPSFILTEPEKQTLLELAHSAIALHLQVSPKRVKGYGDVSDNLNIETGAFVSIYKNKQLMGCIGQFQAKGKALAQVVREVAVSAAFQDNRFPNVEARDLNNIHLEISVLSPLKEISSLNEIVLGKHGILIQKGLKSGTYLPEVAIKAGWGVEELVQRCSADKAKIGKDGWKNAKLYTYEAILIKDRS